MICSVSLAIAKTFAVHLARVVFVADRKTPKQCFTRAKELWITGVPTEFIVVWDELVSDCQEVERRLHERSSEYRVNRAREFFRIPVREAVRALQQEAQTFRVEPSSLTNRWEILGLISSPLLSHSWQASAFWR